MLTCTTYGPPDEDWAQSFWNQPDFCKVTPGQLNKAIAITVDFVNNKYEDPKSGRTMLHNTRKVITLGQRRKQKGRFISTVSHHLMIKKEIIVLTNTLVQETSP
jgi:hypothetical protein